MKKLIIALIIISSAAEVIAADNKGSSEIYAAGSCYKGDDFYIAGYWKNGKWNALPVPKGYSSEADSIAFDSSGSIYVTGIYNVSHVDYAPKNKPGYWKNGKWNPLQAPDDSNFTLTGLVIDLTGNIYICGNYKSGKNTFAGYWKNGKWNALANPYGELEALVSQIALDLSGNVYVGGSCYNNSIRITGYWLNGIWKELRNPYDPNGGSVSSVAFDQSGSIYIAGENKTQYAFSTQHPSQYAGYWKNSEWYECTNPYGPIYIAFASFLSFNSSGNVYVGGVCFNGQIRISGYWEDSKWNAFLNPYGQYDSSLTCLYIDPSGNVYAGGNCEKPVSEYSSDGVQKFPGYWKNGEWNTFNLAGGTTIGHVSSIYVKTR